MLRCSAIGASIAKARRFRVVWAAVNLISIEKLSLTLRDKPLFQDVTLGIDEGEKIGFLGRNGSGKTSFLRLLAGETSPDDGKVSRNKDTRIAVLEQVPAYRPECPVSDYLYEGKGDLVSLVREYRACREGSNIKMLEELTAKMDRMDGWSLEKNYVSLLSELGIRDPDAPMSGLSGGTVKKASLARTLAGKANLLLLDEPTNHLDISTIEWLENYLSGARISFVMVTHDRYFLEAVCTSIMELDGGRIYRYRGNYSAFLEKREERLQAERNEQDKIATILRKELQWLKRGPKARTTKDRGRISRIQDLMDRRTTAERSMADFSSSHRRLGKKILEVKDLRKAWGGRDIVKPFSYSFRRGERIGLVGPNGSGKTTLLDLLAGGLEPDGGGIDIGVNTRFGYYDQTGRPLLQESTVLEFIEKKSERVELGDGAVVSAARFLEIFGFPPAFHRISVSRLSGGEKRRLLLIQVLSENPNFLLLDEPTNDLDLETLRRLEEYILAFPGCVMIVSHDRAFLDRSTDYLFLFDGSGTIRGYAGNYSDYHVDSQAASEPDAADPAGKPVKPAERQKEKTKLSFREKREFDELAAEIEALEDEKADLETAFSDGSADPKRIAGNSRRYAEVERLIHEKTLRWGELSEYV